MVVNAHRVNTGLPRRCRACRDFFLFPGEEPEDTAALTVDVVASRIPRKFGLNPRRDVQVLAPMHRGPAGAGALNTLLQEALTPARDGCPRTPVRRPGLPGRRQGHPAAQQLRQGRGRGLQRHRRRRHRARRTRS